MSIIAITKDLYTQAAEKGVSMSQLMEQLNPTADGEKLTAYERALKQQGIITTSAPEKGFAGDRVEAFYRTDENKTLFPEFIASTMRSEQKTAAEIAVDRMIIDGVISDRTYWLGVLNGTTVADKSKLLTVFENYISKTA